MHRPLPLALLALLVAMLTLPGCVTARPSPGEMTGTTELTAADLADLVLPAPMVLEAEVRRATPVRDAATAPGVMRVAVEGSLTAVIRSSGPVGAEQTWLADVPAPSARGLKGRRVLLFARPVPGRPDVLQLTEGDAQIDWTPERADAVRRLVTEAAAPGALAAITGLTRAFHTPGPVAGEGETQLFLSTADGAPVSITVRRAPGRPPSWALATGDVAGAAAATPTPGGLTWYRLACSLPTTVPTDALPGDARLDQAVRDDLRFVRESLGPCERSRPTS